MRIVAALLLLILVPALPAMARDDANPVLKCVIFPDEQVELGSPVPGVIEQINVRRSDRVTAGQTIARLESRVEQATVDLARARAATNTEIKLRRVEHGYDAQHRDRLQTLQASQAISSQNLDDAERVAKASQLRVRLAQDKRREATLDERRADALLALKTIVSPIDGVVLQINNHVGEYVETRPVARIARLDPLRVEVIAPLSLFGSIHEGMQVAVSPETDPTRERVATVSAVDAVADPGSGTFGIQLELPNPGLELPAGIKCTGRLLPRSMANTRKTNPLTQDYTASKVGTNNPPGIPSSAKTVNPISVAVAAVNPQPDVTGICLAFGPEENEQRARDIVAAAKRLGGQAELNEIDAPGIVGYIVVSEPVLQSEQLNNLAMRLREAYVTDLAIMHHGAYAGRISLGTYNGPVSAEQRRANLSRLGFATEVLPRTRDRRAWRVEVRLPAQDEPDVALAELSRVVGDIVTQAEACDPQRTAARW